MVNLEKIAKDYELSPNELCNVDGGRLYLSDTQEKYIQGVEKLTAFMTFEGSLSYISIVSSDKLEEHLNRLDDIVPGSKFYRTWHREGIVHLPKILGQEKQIKDLAVRVGERDEVIVYNLDEYHRLLKEIKRKGFDDLSFLPPYIKI